MFVYLFAIYETGSNCVSYLDHSYIYMIWEFLDSFILCNVSKYFDYMYICALLYIMPSEARLAVVSPASGVAYVCESPC